MKITDVQILNWEAPGEVWWKHAKENPDEQLIDAQMLIKMSFNEYMELVEKSKRSTPESEIVGKIHDRT